MESYNISDTEDFAIELIDHPFMFEINKSVCTIINTPFNYILGKKVFTDLQFKVIFNWLKNQVDWKHQQHKEGEFDSFRINFEATPKTIYSIINENWLTNLAKDMSDLFQTKLSPSEKMLSHVFRVNHYINIHNDNPINYELETHRMVIYFNNPSEKLVGGELVLYNNYDVFDIHRIISPSSNSFVAFAASPNSYHSVNQIAKGERFTLNIGFFDDRHLVKEANFYSKIKNYKGEKISALAKKVFSSSYMDTGRSLYDYSLSTAITFSEFVADDEEFLMIALFHPVYKNLKSGIPYYDELIDELSSTIGAETKMKTYVFGTLNRVDLYSMVRKINKHDSQVFIIMGLYVNKSDLINFLLLDIACFLEYLNQFREVPAELTDIMKILQELSYLIDETLLNLIKYKINYKVEYILANLMV